MSKINIFENPSQNSHFVIKKDQNFLVKKAFFKKSLISWVYTLAKPTLLKLVIFPLKREVMLYLRSESQKEVVDEKVTQNDVVLLFIRLSPGEQ